MDSNLMEAIIRNDTHSFISLVHCNEGILERRDASLNTPLHLATRFGHVGLVAEIMKFCPKLVAAENKKLETPLHQACRQGDAEISTLLLETKPLVAIKLDHENQSAFFLACRQGNLDIVKLMLNQSWLMEFEEDLVGSSSVGPVNVAITRGHNGNLRIKLDITLVPK